MIIHPKVKKIINVIEAVIKTIRATEDETKPKKRRQPNEQRQKSRLA